jgi:uncharacterized membrane protein
VSDQRGFVSEGIAGALLFQRCDAASPSEKLMLVLDKSPGNALTAGVGEVRQVMHDPDRPLYVEFRGEAAGDKLTVRQFHRAIGHVASCAAAPALPAGVRLLVQGGQPAWRLQSSPSGARLEVVGKKALQFEPMSLTTFDTAKRVRTFTAMPLPGGAPMRLVLTEEACNDSGSETAYGARAVAQWGTQRMEGCAARF